MLAHTGRPLAPHDVWGAWNLDPVLLGGLVLATWAYRRGVARRRPSHANARRDRCFVAAIAAVSVSLVSPLDALSGVLASAHMVQHVLLVLVAAPLLALSAPTTTLLRGSPALVHDASVRWRRRLSITRTTVRRLRHPATVWLLHVGALWFWHAAVPYDAAVHHHLLHVVEHAIFLITGVLFWRVIISAREADRVPQGLGILLVFAMAMQSVFLSALMTFARGPWYAAYATSTAPWGIEPLADQQLAGVIMWIPAGLIYVGAGLGLLVAWIRSTERQELLA